MLCVLAIVASLFFLLHTPKEKGEELATNASEALGLRAAEEVARLLGDKGKVAVIEMDIQPGQAPTAVACSEKFQAVLKKHNITVARTKKIPGGLTALVMGGGVSRNDYIAVAEASPTVDAVISFASLPGFAPEELQQYQEKHPPLVIVDIFGTVKGPVLPELVEKKAVALAFVPRAADEVVQNETKIFERYYRFLRAGGK